MNLEKSKKRIAKRAKMGFQGYPELSITYFGKNQLQTDQVVLTLILEDGGEAMEEKFVSNEDIRNDAVVQSAIVKMIERSMAKTVVINDSI